MSKANLDEDTVITVSDCLARADLGLSMAGDYLPEDKELYYMIYDAYEATRKARKAYMKKYRGEELDNE